MRPWAVRVFASDIYAIQICCDTGGPEDFPLPFVADGEGFAEVFAGFCWEMARWFETNSWLGMYQISGGEF